MKTKYKIVISIIAILIISILVGKYYYDNHTNSGILKRVVSRDGYTVNRKDEVATINLFIKPEWIPFKKSEKYEINKELTEIDGTKIYIHDVVNMDNEIYFTFETKYKMNCNHGKILYNYVIDEEGHINTPKNHRDYNIYDNNHKSIDYGSTGLGPDNKFSFGISKENFDDIKQGFYVDVNSLVLYEYTKK